MNSYLLRCICSLTDCMRAFYRLLFILLVSTNFVSAEPTDVPATNIDSSEANSEEKNSPKKIVQADRAEPKTVFDAVVMQLEHNEKLSYVSGRDDTRENNTAIINLKLSNVVNEAVVENTAERLARRKADLADAVNKVVDEYALEESASRPSSDQELKQTLNRKQQVSQKAGRKKSKGKKKLTQGEMLTANFIMKTQPKRTTDQNSGWVYLGRFVRNDWLSKTLDIKKSLPKVGRHYKVMQSLNMRVEAPTKAGSSQLIKKLKRDDSIKILRVRPSGRNGHYWAQVEYQ